MNHDFDCKRRLGRNSGEEHHNNTTKQHQHDAWEESLVSAGTRRGDIISSLSRENEAGGGGFSMQLSTTSPHMLLVTAVQRTQRARCSLNTPRNRPKQCYA